MEGIKAGWKQPMQVNQRDSHSNEYDLSGIFEQWAIAVLKLNLYWLRFIRASLPNAFSAENPIAAAISINSITSTRR